MSEASNRTKQKYISLGICVYCGKNKAAPDRRGCLSCNNKNNDRAKKFAAEKPDLIKKWQKKANKNRRSYRLQNMLCVQCGEPQSPGFKYCDNCLKYRVRAVAKYNKRYPEKQKEYYSRIRLEVLKKYGDKCEICGENLLEFLCIDHRNNDGSYERNRSSFGTAQFYARLRKNPIRKDLRVLCYNCNNTNSIQEAKNASSKQIERVKAREYRLKVKKEVMKKYGNACSCCGKIDIDCLAIDHKNNDGGKERRQRYGRNYCCTSKWYLMLRRETKRDDLQVLCHTVGGRKPHPVAKLP